MFFETELGDIKEVITDGRSVIVKTYKKGEIKKRTNKNGEVETYSPWDELIDSGAEIEWITDEQKAATEREQKIQDFKAKRAEALANAIVTISTGKEFHADEKSISRMTESKQSIKDAVEIGLLNSVDEFQLKWTLCTDESGTATEITYQELVEACALANQKRSQLWLKEE